jgi:hypothetical protein
MLIMNDNSKQIHDWQDKLKHSFDSEEKLLSYLLETMDNFLYRYLETTENKNLKSFQIAPHIFGQESFESSMVEALKITHPEAKAGIMELAKTVPKAQKPMVKYRLQAQVKELTSERGHLVLTASINWDFPLFMDKTKVSKREIDFKYTDLGQFRKELALKLEAACELFS